MSRQPTLRVLVVDDDPERREYFRRRFRSAVLATNYAEDVRALAGERFDLVLLDHDLRDRARNGQDIADFMTRRLPRRCRPKVVIHRTNTRGAYAMLVALRSTGFEVESVPFIPNSPASTSPSGLHVTLFGALDRPRRGRALHIELGRGVGFRVGEADAPSESPGRLEQRQGQRVGAPRGAEKRRGRGRGPSNDRHLGVRARLHARGPRGAS